MAKQPKSNKTANAGGFADLIRDGQRISGPVSNDLPKSRQPNADVPKTTIPPSDRVSGFRSKIGKERTEKQDINLAKQKDNLAIRRIGEEILNVGNAVKFIKKSYKEFKEYVKGKRTRSRGIAQTAGETGGNGGVIEDGTIGGNIRRARVADTINPITKIAAGLLLTVGFVSSSVGSEFTDKGINKQKNIEVILDKDNPNVTQKIFNYKKADLTTGIKHAAGTLAAGLVTIPNLLQTITEQKTDTTAHTTESTIQNNEKCGVLGTIKAGIRYFIKAIKFSPNLVHGIISGTIKTLGQPKLVNGIFRKKVAHTKNQL
ncbi:hypothetical protein ACFL4A_01650 [bacterium]